MKLIDFENNLQRPTFWFTCNTQLALRAWCTHYNIRYYDDNAHNILIYDITTLYYNIIIYLLENGTCLIQVIDNNLKTKFHVSIVLKAVGST